MRERVVRNLGAVAVNAIAWGFWLGLVGVGVGLTVTVIFGLAGQSAGFAVLSPVVAGVALAVWRATRIVLLLGPSQISIRNFAGAWTVSIKSVRRIVPTQTRFPAPLKCAGFDVEGKDRPIPAAATASWGWRLGQRPSKQSQRLVDQLHAWAAEANLPATIEAADLF